MLHFAKRDVPVLPGHDSFIITAGLFIELLEVMEKEFKKQIGVLIDIRSAEKSVRVRSRGDGSDIVKLSLSYSQWRDRDDMWMSRK